MTKAIRVAIDEMKSGEEFLEYAQSDLAGSQYDIVILDNNMGGMDGIEALETAKSAGFQGRVSSIRRILIRRRWSDSKHLPTTISRRTGCQSPPSLLPSSNWAGVWNDTGGLFPARLLAAPTFTVC